ncbi:MAG TPA: hypothetical protein VI796_07460 [Candidatus Thermoplasmatota archaeon]|nr:hypothetical protein [Candidatus Thermoplasmatota archaeon]
MSAWEPFAAAALAPVALWVLWRLQTTSVELLRRVLLGMARFQRWMYLVVSWFGTFLHEVSHATVLLLSGHGIREFRAGVESGHVQPARLSRGPVSFLFFLVAAMAPLFIPPALVLAGVVLFVDRGLVPWASTGPGLDAALTIGRDFLVEFPQNLALAFANLDLARPAHAAVLALALLGIPGSRPSHVKGSRFHGTKDEGDVAVLRSRIRQNPLPLLVFLALVYAAHIALTRWVPEGYWYPFEAVVAVALTGILLAVLGMLWWGLAAVDGRAQPWIGWMSPLLFFAVEVAFRQMPTLESLGWEPWKINAAALGAWALSAVVLRLAFPRRATRS